MKTVSPFAINFDLSRLPEAGTDVPLSPTAKERAGLARWAGVDSLEALKGSVHLKKLGAGHFSYEARFTAEIVQPCVVTLEPVRTHIEREFKRLFQIDENARKTSEKRIVQLSSKAEEEDVETLSSPVLDIAAPVLEELSLAIDPYPRAPGAAFQAPSDEKGSADTPFAVLKSLKTKR